MMDKYTDKYILGIESSCDDTGIGLIRNNQIIANKVLKQEHKQGVIPEYAARAHHQALYEHAYEIIKEYPIDLIAYTKGPGLIGSLFVGASFAKSLAYGLNVPSVGVHHLAGHILLPYWLYHVNLPYLCLLVSGGHTMIVLVEYTKNIDQKFRYKVLSTTLDDAVGEVLDKIARKLGLDYPGGPHIEKLAALYSGTGDANFVPPNINFQKFKFPYTMRNRVDFSFSGLKTAAIEQIDIDASLEEKIEFCYFLQKHIAFLLAQKMREIASKLKIENGYDIKHWAVSGGVAANKTICHALEDAAGENDAEVFYPPMELCTDNGVMIACVAQLTACVEDMQLDKMLTARPDAQLML